MQLDGRRACSAFLPLFPPRQSVSLSLSQATLARLCVSARVGQLWLEPRSPTQLTFGAERAERLGIRAGETEETIKTSPSSDNNQVPSQNFTVTSDAPLQAPPR